MLSLQRENNFVCCPLYGTIYSVPGYLPTVFDRNQCSLSPIALTVFLNKLFLNSAITESHIGLGGLWGGRHWVEGNVFLAKILGPSLLSVELFLQKTAQLIKYSPFCNLQTDISMHAFLPYMPKIIHAIFGCGMLNRKMQFLMNRLSLLRPQDEW